MNSPDRPPKAGEGPEPSTATSRSLIDRVKAGDEDAWDRLVRLYGPLVYRWCRRFDLPDQEMADIFQDVFQAVAAHIAGFKKEKPGDTFRGWLRIIAVNKVRDHFRKWGREPGGVGGTDAQMRFASLPAAELPQEEPGDEGEDRVLFRHLLDLIRAEFEDRTWQAFWSTAVEGRPPREVAIDLKMTPGAVRVAKSRVLQRLREALGELG
jgi:RNA polymerase sigma-70 factor (ECF subfamily)